MRYAAANRVIPRNEWKEVDLSPLGVPVLDQGNHGSCVGHGSTSAFWFAYLIANDPKSVPDGGFSPTSLYALVNGGRDNGAVVSDAMDALMNKGVALMNDYPENYIFDRSLPSGVLAKVNAQRQRFRVGDAFHTASFDEIASGLMLGFASSFGITIRQGFNNPQSNGIISPGGMILGGHCMCGYGLANVGGKWYIRVRNSWGTRWGVGGNCLLGEEHFRGDADAFAVRATLSDPSDPNPPPVNPA
jgi:hypothetical protein